jgi:phosphatidylglycerophosphatase C
VLKKSIAFFDFDGTVTKGDSLLSIIQFANGKVSFLLGFALLSPWIIGMKLGLISNSDAKQRVLNYFFGNKPLLEFNEVCMKFVIEKLPSLIRSAALQEIYNLLQNQFEVVIVTASPENYVGIWCEKNGLSCIGTRLETKGKILTGKLNGKNCYGPEKVQRILECYNLSTYQEVFAYGDSAGDLPMLSLATRAYFKPFRV